MLMYMLEIAEGLLAYILVKVYICSEFIPYSLDPAKAQYYLTHCTNEKSFARLQLSG